MNALGDASGESTESILALQAAISKTSNQSPEKARDLLQELSNRIGASSKVGAEEQALNKMGLSFQDLDGIGPEKQISEISKAFNKMLKNPAIGKNRAARIMDEFLGGPAKELIPLFKNFEEAMQKARVETKGLSTDLIGLAKPLDQVDDLMRAVDLKFSEFALQFLKVLESSGLSLSEIVKTIQSLDLSSIGDSLSATVKQVMEDLKSMSLWDFFQKQIKSLLGFLAQALKPFFDMVRGIIDGIIVDLKDSITDGIRAGLPSFLGGGKIKPAISKNEKVKLEAKKLENQGESQIQILSNIFDKITGTVYS